MLEKFALFKIAFCKAPVFSRASLRLTSVATSAGPETAPGMASSWFCADIHTFVDLSWPGRRKATDLLWLRLRAACCLPQAIVELLKCGTASNAVLSKLLPLQLQTQSPSLAESVQPGT